jgi:hypothetical protein
VRNEYRNSTGRIGSKPRKRSADALHEFGIKLVRNSAANVVRLENGVHGDSIVGGHEMRP